MSQQPTDGEADPNKSSPPEESVGPRFKKGAEDLDQLEGIEKQQHRSRQAQHELEHLEQTGSDAEPEPDQVYPVIREIEKSRQRLRNRFKGIKNAGDAEDEFGS